MQSPKPRSRMRTFGFNAGICLLSAHSFLALIALTSFSNGWWPIIFAVDLPASWPVFMLMDYLKDAKRFNLDWTDDILKACAVTHEGKVLHGPTLKALQD